MTAIVWEDGHVKAEEQGKCHTKTEDWSGTSAS